MYNGLKTKLFATIRTYKVKVKFLLYCDYLFIHWFEKATNQILKNAHLKICPSLTFCVVMLGF